jgi:hypothetical protein
MKNKNIFRNLKNSDSAVVGIVVTVLLIGLAMVIMVMLNTIYVPQWLESSEAGHMEDVAKQFTQLKYALDIQSTVNDSTAFTTSVTLGNKEIPIFNKGRTYDTLDIINDAITIDFTPGGSYTSDPLIFSSGNSYFVDQSYIYEAGAIIISQDEKNMVYGNPTIVLTDIIIDNSTGTPRNKGANITFYIVEIDGLSGKTNVRGYGTYPIYTQAIGTSHDTFIHNLTSITITTNYPNAWKTILEQAIEKKWFGPPDPYQISLDSNTITLTFEPSYEFNFYIRSKTIITQIAFGLSE